MISCRMGRVSVRIPAYLAVSEIKLVIYKALGTRWYGRKRPNTAENCPKRVQYGRKQPDTPGYVSVNKSDTWR